MATELATDWEPKKLGQSWPFRDQKACVDRSCFWDWVKNGRPTCYWLSFKCFAFFVYFPRLKMFPQFQFHSYMLPRIIFFSMHFENLWKIINPWTIFFTKMPYHLHLSPILLIFHGKNVLPIPVPSLYAVSKKKNRNTLYPTFDSGGRSPPPTFCKRKLDWIFGDGLPVRDEGSQSRVDI